MSFMAAIEDFRQARRRAAMELIMARLSGRSAELLSYDEVRQRLGAFGVKPPSLREIPVDAIVGSVGRYSDFTRSFLPRTDSDEERWSRVRVATDAGGGLPPIEVYQIGDVYFVRDGHHRVSVARQLGAKHMQAYVSEVQCRIPLSPDIQPDDLILKAEYAAFLDRTHLDEIRPQADLSVTVPGQYERLLEHIETHRYFLGLDHRRDIPFAEAVGNWYDTVYLPVVQAIREQGVLRDFPGRTEADLYLWVSEHRAALFEELGWEIETGAAAADLAAHHSGQPLRVLARVGERVLEAVTPDLLTAGPPAGQWREERKALQRGDCLFPDIAVAVSGDQAGWQAVDQALRLAQRDRSRLLGLHVVPSESDWESEPARALRAEFERRRQEAGVEGGFALELGKVARTIADRARWVDLMVVSLAHPPSPQPLARLGSGFRNLLLWCPGPVLAVPGPSSPLRSGLLAYDGSRKAWEALFIATYLAARWQMSLTVVAAEEGGREPASLLEEARNYLESHDVAAAYEGRGGPAAAAILAVAGERASDLVLMGGYGHGPILDAVVGSTVDEVLRAARWPVLVCR